MNDSWQDLVIAVLAVNRFSIEKAYALSHQLREQGLCEPANLATWNTNEIASRLRESGYDRGVFLNQLISERLAALGRFVAAEGAENCQRTVSSKNRDAISQLFLRVHGIGHTVLDNFFLLQEIDR